VSVHDAALASSLALLLLWAASFGLYIGSRRDGYLLGAPTSAEMRERSRQINVKARPLAKVGMIVFGAMFAIGIVVTLTT
jgi:hypothetical protein